MGTTCCKTAHKRQAEAPGGTLGVMFRRIDKDGKGYIDLRDLNALMKDDYKAYFQGRGADHIMEKFGQNGKMSFENFQMWWNSTYTTYNDEDTLCKTIDDVLLQVDEEDEEEAQDARSLHGRNVPSNTDVAISRS